MMIESSAFKFNIYTYIDYIKFILHAADHQNHFIYIYSIYSIYDDYVFIYLLCQVSAPSIFRAACFGR